MTLLNKINPRAKDDESRNAIQTEDTEPSVDWTCDEDSGPRKYFELWISDSYKQELFAERNGNSLGLDVVNVERNLLGRCFFMHIWKRTIDAWQRWEEVSRKLGDMLTIWKNKNHSDKTPLKLVVPVLNISTAWAERTRGPQCMR